MSANPDIATPTARKKTAQGKKRSDTALGHKAKDTASLESAKEVDWPVVLLGEIAEIKLGKMLDKAKHRFGRRLPYLRNINVRWGTIQTDDLLEMNFEEDQIDRFGLQANDVLVCEGGEPGRASVWNGHLPDLKFQKALHRVRFKVPFEPRLLVYLLELLARSGGLERRFTGSTIKHFTREAFLKLPIPFPPEAEQRRIVAEIEKQFTRLEAGVAALRRVQANLKRYRAAVLKAACEGCLVPTQAELAKADIREAKFETGEALIARILARRRALFEHEKASGGRKKYNEPSPIEPGLLPITPEGWTLASAEAVCSSVRDGTHDTPAYVDDGFPLITSKNLLPTGLDFENVKLVSREDHIEIGKRSGVERSDILFAMIGTIGNPVVVETDREFSIKNVGLFKANPNFILSRYLRYWFMSPTFSQWLEPKQRGTTQKFVPLGLLRALVVALPPLVEQSRIVAEIERRLSVVEELEATVSANLQRATGLRQSILQKAFSGELLAGQSRSA